MQDQSHWHNAVAEGTRDGDKFFTIVFKGDIRKLGFNPLKAETVFGEVVAASVGDAFFVLDLLRERLLLAGD